MTPLKELILLDRNSGTPLYLQLASGLIYAIRSGHLRKGLKLPGSRKLADLFGVQRNTVIAAYDELLAQGWITMAPQKGAFVSEHLPDVVPGRIGEGNMLRNYPSESGFAFRGPHFFDVYIHPPSRASRLVINDGFPDVRLAPAEELARELRSITRVPTFRKHFGYTAPEGSLQLREVLTDFLSDTRGLPISPENIFITRGAQMGIYMAARLLLQPGDKVVVGEPGYLAATQTFKQMGAMVARVPVDEAGIDVSKIETLCKKKKVRLVYVIPHHHHPTTVTLTPERRMQLLELAAKYGFAIIEDDYDYDFHYSNNPVLPLASLDYKGHVIYVGTLTKTLVPAVRLGFVVAPKNVITSMANVRRSIDWQGDTLMELAIAQLYKNGTIGRHIKKAVKLYHQRRDHFCTLLQRKAGDFVQFNTPGGGMSVWATFKGVHLKDVAERAAQKGLMISNGATFNDVVDYNACRMGFASLNEREQRLALDILAQCLY